METVFGIAGVILLGCSIYVLARADSWRRLTALGLVSGGLVIPIGLAFIGFTRPMASALQDVALGLSAFIPFAVLFALSKSVANRIRLKGEA